MTRKETLRIIAENFEGGIPSGNIMADGLLLSEAWEILRAEIRVFNAREDAIALLRRMQEK